MRYHYLKRHSKPFEAYMDSFLTIIRYSKRNTDTIYMANGNRRSRFLSRTTIIYPMKWHNIQRLWEAKAGQFTPSELASKQNVNVLVN